MRWHRAMMRFTLLAATSIVAAPAAAQLRPLVQPPASAAEAQRAGVTVFLLNEGTVDLPAQGPEAIDAVAQDGTSIRLVAAPDGEPAVKAGGFVKLHYRLAAQGGAVAPARQTATIPAPPPRAETVTLASRGESRGLLDRFRPYEPIYGAFGTGDAGGKLQLSFAARLLGRDDGPRLSFAYTQNMLWAIDRDSGPIGPTTYSPQVFVDVPLSPTLVAGGGYAHDSNGEGPATSIDVNRIFARATRSIDLGRGWVATLTPQAWFYVGDQGVAPDIERYWGYTSLIASIAQADGIKLSAMVRGNPGTGKGSGELFVSYPLAALGLNGDYLFGQGYSGYGEALSNYDRRDTHVRFGVAFTR